MRNSWARDFLDEDNNDMSDPSYFFIRMVQAAREQAAKDAAIGALSEAARQERARRALLEQFYGQQVLLGNGICPSCLEQLPSCVCEDNHNGS